MNNFRERSPILRHLDSTDSDSEEDTALNAIMAHNISEINLAKEIIPLYEGGSKNLSYFIQQCEKFISTYRITTPGQEQCTLNKLLFEICCSKLTGAARDTLVISNCTTWSQVKDALINRFGDQRNETLLENDLITCFQSTNENYDQYYERIKSKLQILLEHVNLREVDHNIRIYKTNLYTNRALNTYQAGLLEPYRSFILYKSPVSLEDCLVQLRNYDNHKQQINFLNFVRQKTPNKTSRFQEATKPFKANYYQPVPNPQTNAQPIASPSNHQTQNLFPRRPINNLNQFNNYNSQRQKQQFTPTPMSISTNNTFQTNRNQQPRTNYFRSTAPRNFISEELHNVQENDHVETHNNYQNVENFPTEASTELPST